MLVSCRLRSDARAKKRYRTCYPIVRSILAEEVGCPVRPEAHHPHRRAQAGLATVSLGML